MPHRTGITRSCSPFRPAAEPQGRRKKRAPEYKHVAQAGGADADRAARVGVAGPILASVIALAGPRPDVARVTLTSDNGYTTHFSQRRKLRRTSWPTSGAASRCRPPHGFPLRAALPGKPASAWVKWLAETQLFSGDRVVKTRYSSRAAISYHPSCAVNPFGCGQPLRLDVR